MEIMNFFENFWFEQTNKVYEILEVICQKINHLKYVWDNWLYKHRQQCGTSWVGVKCWKKTAISSSLPYMDMHPKYFRKIYKI